MRRLRELKAYRDRNWERAMTGGEIGDDFGGCFRIPVKPGVELSVIASAGGGWDHLSVSNPHRCPTWAEMEHVKRLFFHSHEVAMQLHVGTSDHISIHPNCLHIWRPHDVEIPLPPKEFV